MWMKLYQFQVIFSSDDSSFKNSLDPEDVSLLDFAWWGAIVHLDTPRLCSSWVRMQISFMLKHLPLFFLYPGFHEENSDVGKRHFCHAPEIALPHHIKSGSKNCQTCLWDKQVVHFFVLPSFARFCSAKPGLCFRCIVQVTQCCQVGTC